MSRGRWCDGSVQALSLAMSLVWATSFTFPLPLHPHVWVLGDIRHVPLVDLPLDKLAGERSNSRVGECEKMCTYPLQVVVVWLFGLYPLEDGLVFVSHSKQVTLTPCLVQTAGEIERGGGEREGEKEPREGGVDGRALCVKRLSEGLPSLLVVVHIVNTAFGSHDTSHLVQEEAIVSLHNSASLFLHLQLLQVEMKMHVCLRRLVVYHRPSIADLHTHIHTHTHTHTHTQHNEY